MDEYAPGYTGEKLSETHARAIYLVSSVPISATLNQTRHRFMLFYEEIVGRDKNINKMSKKLYHYTTLTTSIFQSIDLQKDISFSIITRSFR